MTSYDTLVIGLGAMGSAALHHLALRGGRVAGFDAFDPPHTLGSTHGRSRIIREAYFEHPSYVPLVRRAYENWSSLERSTGQSLFRATGGLMIGTPGSVLVEGTLASASTHGIEVEQLSSSEVRRRFNAFDPPAEMVGIHERRAGVLFPEACVRAQLESAIQHGADVRAGTRVVGLGVAGGVFSVVTSAGETFASGRVVLAAGAWASGLLAMVGVSLPLAVERQTMHWLDSPSGDASLGPDGMPIMMIEHQPGRFFYSIPDLGDGVKAAIHHEGALVSPDTVNRDITAEDTAPVLGLARRYIPRAGVSIRESVVCLYTDTSDGDFIIDTIDGAPGLVLVSACSGHGFKFASAIGEVAAQMALGENVDLDLSHFSSRRFTDTHEKRRNSLLD